jgi:hypothetical protein
MTSFITTAARAFTERAPGAKVRPRRGLAAPPRGAAPPASPHRTSHLFSTPPPTPTRPPPPRPQLCVLQFSNAVRVEVDLAPVEDMAAFADKVATSMVRPRGLTGG